MQPLATELARSDGKGVWGWASKPVGHNRPRLLFVGEAVTMAHVLRPWALATSLDPNQYDVHFGVDLRLAADLLDHLRSGTRVHSIHTIEPKVFKERLASGSPVYQEDELEAYLAEDLDLIDRIQPDVIVGDFRVTLSAAAKMLKIPVITLMHAHWSPLSLARVPTPDLPAESLLGSSLLGAMIRRLSPWVFQRHARAFNRVLARRGLPPVSGIRQMYTQGSRTLYLDLPELAPTGPLPPFQSFIGPLPVEPQVDLPSWAKDIPTDRPVVYVSPGSSGNSSTMQKVIRCLAQQYTVLVATAGRLEIPDVQGTVLVSNLLPGNWACEQADVVICNGGTGAIYQALGAGKPVLALPSNMDQWFVTEALVGRGAALCHRTRSIQPTGVQESVFRLLNEKSFRERAMELGRRMSVYDPYRAVHKQIDDLLTTG